MRRQIVRLVIAVLAATGILATPGDATAGFLATTLSYEYLFPTTSSTPIGSSTFLVTPGVERLGIFGNGNTSTDVASFDVSDFSILIDFYGIPSPTASPFNGFHLSDTTNNVPAITGVTINPATNLSGFNAARISFDANNIFGNFESLNANSNTIVLLDVTFAGGSVATPLPPTLLAGFLGVAMLAGARRFRRA